MSPLRSASARPAFMSLAPPAVGNGAAVAAGSFISSQMLRLVIGLQDPHMADEEQFLEALRTKGSPEFMHFLTADLCERSFFEVPTRRGGRG